MVWPHIVPFQQLFGRCHKFAAFHCMHAALASALLSPLLVLVDRVHPPPVPGAHLVGGRVAWLPTSVLTSRAPRRKQGGIRRPYTHRHVGSTVLHVYGDVACFEQDAHHWNPGPSEATATFSA